MFVGTEFQGTGAIYTVTYYNSGVQLASHPWYVLAMGIDASRVVPTATDNRVRGLGYDCWRRVA